MGACIAYNESVTTSPRGPRVRRVSRVIREIDPWSAFRVGIVFHGVLYLMALIALVLLWSVASATGTIVLLTAIWVLCATVFNLITDLVGGIRVSVLEEEVVVSTVEGEGKRQ
jgi:hypothetical protein